ncbi:hypothetical protein PTSG_12876 [Salpingoeca rosetta]|uniref:mannan endo-1,4-beta-mannosidase n=1 Tax=Salpingoeca rosetta (strain ATCC 50818 / BSB-021) TaxID=946362 RepID=F2UME2_SALR5|nr:uncharacterized protein PTSG_12876 [Salpingoeca rosetta]EGD78291.1 hypothetical protein PTSG_12876 [Salpingoeca rosetta]|eukprot:XP_004989614.1 hypothetical protein PTSG_12876 [Salpingoeca rosetta]
MMIWAVVAVVLLATSPCVAAEEVSEFVVRDGSQLKLKGKPWVYSGCNMYWLGLDSNCEAGLNESCIHYPSFYRIDDAIETAQGLGFSVIRAHTLGISSGSQSNGLALHPNRTTYNDKAFATIDYAIYKAKLAGIRLVVPFTDNWDYFHGAYRNFVDWRGYTCKTTQVPSPGSDCIRFYNDQQVVDDFHDYVAHILNHVNNFTGVALKHEPAILAWETGNELAEKGPIFSNWTNDLGRFIKVDLGAKQLVMDGRQEWSYGMEADALASPYIDMYTDHYYMDWASAIKLMRKDGAAVHAANKVFVVGEYGPGKYTVDQVQSFLHAVETDTDTQGAPLVSGDTWWSFFGHGSVYGFVNHSDGFTIHYPGEDAQHHAMINALREHAYRKRGVPLPSKLPVPGTPSITLAEASAPSRGANACKHVKLTWRGAAMACNYTIQRSPQLTPTPAWTTICNACATDLSPPWWDNTTCIAADAADAAAGAAGAGGGGSHLPFYRLAGVSCDGQQGPYSSPVQATTTTATTTTATAVGAA